MIKIETSDGKDWFDVGLQTYTSEELQCSTQNMKLTSDWKGVDLSKRGVSDTVSDMCPFSKIFNLFQEPGPYIRNVIH